MKKLSLVALLATALIITATSAREEEMKVGQTHSISPVTNAYTRAIEKMRPPMMIGIEDPNPDVAFVKGMIAHHEGAIAMAKIELKYGKNPQLKSLARSIISSQGEEVKFMKKWLRNNNK